MKSTITTLLLLQLGMIASAQTDITAELQLYPTGIIPGITAEFATSERGMVSTRLAANIFDHRDRGVHESETGSGWGGSLGYRYHFAEGHMGWHLGIRADIWSNDVDWEDTNPAQSGMTSITVLQPTAQLGYTMILGTDWVLKPSLGFGWEWNAKTTGEPTGEGAILLLGVQVGKRF